VTCCPDVTSVPCAASHEQYDADPDALAPVLLRVTLLRAVYSDRQLFAVMCEFWSDHFNIDLGTGDCRWTKPGDEDGRGDDGVRAASRGELGIWHRPRARKRECEKVSLRDMHRGRRGRRRSKRRVAIP
jgi:hypothetical protein